MQNKPHHPTPRHPRHGAQRTWRQWLRHLSLDVADARRLLPPEACHRLEACIQASEARHLGELRVCVEAGFDAAQLWRGLTARQRAIELFAQLRVWDTEHNNGVLIYLLLAERRIEILADRGLMGQLDSADHWDRLVGKMSAELAQHHPEQSLQWAIEQIGELLHKHYPIASGQTNPNELPDAIVLM